MTSWAARWHDWHSRLEARSSWFAITWVIVALGGFAVHAHRSYPLGEWSTFFWARAWLGALTFGLASLAIGLEALALLGARAGSFAERFTVAMGLGVLTFALGIFVAGLFGCLGLPFFLLWPALLLLVGGRALLRHFRGISRLLSRFGAPSALPRSVAQALAALLISAGAFGLYLQVITPSNIGFDARWYHLPIAEGYAATGRIRPFPEGWYLGAYPQLASWLYTWAFLAPGALKHHLCLAAHLEFLLLLATVGGVSALAARLISGARLRYGGAALFLFPSLFLYDSNLNCGADHVLAFWAAPLGLVLLRYLRRAGARHAVLLGILLGAASLTKYQAVYFTVPIALVLALDLTRRRQPRPLLLAAGAALVVSSPHWLKNWIAYGDPLYPNLCRWLPDHPFFRGALGFFEKSYWFSGTELPQHGAAKCLATVRALFRFSFFPLGWARLRDEPMVFGSLFTLLLPLVWWIRPRWRVLLIVGCVHVGLAVWFLTYPYDRYLQALLPWMAACLAACLAAAWRTGPTALRFALVLLVLFQMAWGGDVYFLRTQAMLGELPLQAMSAPDPDKKFARSPYPGQELADIGASLGKGSKLVGHDFYQSLGVGAQLICDNPAWQGGLDYLELDRPERVLRAWRRFGATHLLWPFKKEAREADDLARDAVFARASVAFTESSSTTAGYRVSALVDRVPPPARGGPTRIAWLACGGDRALGAYTPAGLASGALERPLLLADLERDASSALAEVNAVWLHPGCADTEAAQALVAREFTEVMVSGDLRLWIRLRPIASPA